MEINDITVSEKEIQKVLKEAKDGPENKIPYVPVTKETIENAFKKIKKEISLPQTEFYQTPYATETIAIIRSLDGAISIGLARAGRTDIENRQVSSKAGMEIAEGRAKKAMKSKLLLIEKNYLRGIYAPRIENV